MRLEITERGPKEFYDEVMYISANYRKYRANPEKRPRSQTKVYTGYCAASLLVILVFLWDYFRDHQGIFLLLSGMMLVCFILLVVLVLGMKKRVNLMMNEQGTKVVEINESGVKYESEQQDLRMKWSNISNVIINKNSIIFMPVSEAQLMISVWTGYKEEILKGIEASGHMDLVVDNTAGK